MYQCLAKPTSANKDYGSIANNMDYLNLANRGDIQSLLANEGTKGEKVIFSAAVRKINGKGKRQKRVLMITQCAIYNLKQNKKMNKSQRRICIASIGMLTLSS